MAGIGDYKPANVINNKFFDPTFVESGTKYYELPLRYTAFGDDYNNWRDDKKVSYLWKGIPFSKYKEDAHGDYSCWWHKLQNLSIPNDGQKTRTLVNKIKQGVIENIVKYLHTNVTSQNYFSFQELFNALENKDKKDNATLENLNDAFFIPWSLNKPNPIELNDIFRTESDRKLFEQKKLECELFAINENIKSKKTEKERILNLNDDQFINDNSDRIVSSPRLSSIVLNKLVKWDKNYKDSKFYKNLMGKCLDKNDEVFLLALINNLDIFNTYTIYENGSIKNRPNINFPLLDLLNNKDITNNIKKEKSEKIKDIIKQKLNEKIIKNDINDCGGIKILKGWIRTYNYKNDYADFIMTELEKKASKKLNELLNKKEELKQDKEPVKIIMSGYKTDTLKSYINTLTDNNKLNNNDPIEIYLQNTGKLLFKGKYKQNENNENKLDGIYYSNRVILENKDTEYSYYEKKIGLFEDTFINFYGEKDKIYKTSETTNIKNDDKSSGNCAVCSIF